MNLLIKGGARFIGSNFDFITYDSNLPYLSDTSAKERYRFTKDDISDKTLVSEVINEYLINCIINFAVESHVDNSIKKSEHFCINKCVGYDKFT